MDSWIIWKRWHAHIVKPQSRKLENQAPNLGAADNPFRIKQI
jgi:hypothetical protein